MNNSKIVLLLLSILLSAFSCKKDDNFMENSSNTSKNSKLLGTWEAKSIFLSDASTGVCLQDKAAKPITITFTNEGIQTEAGYYKLNGNSVINNYFGSYTIDDFNETTMKGTIKIPSIGSTKMGGSQEMMLCESNYFTALRDATGFEIYTDDEKTVLNIGRLKAPNSSPRDGGTFYVFEKK